MIHFVSLVAHRDSLCRTNALVWFSHNIPDVFDCPSRLKKCAGGQDNYMETEQYRGFGLPSPG